MDLCAFRRRLGEADPDADETHWLASASECFIEKRPEILQGGREAGALGGCAGKVVELQFHKNFGDRSGRFLLGKISHQFLEEVLQSFFALLDRRKIDREGFFRAERFARTIPLHRPVIDASAKIVEIETKLPEKIDKVRPREAL